MKNVRQERRRIFLCYFKTVLRDFAPLLLSLVLICVICSVVFLLFPSDSIEFNKLTLSRENPWGVITSMFLHGNLPHLSNNLAGLILYFSLAALCNCYFSSRQRRYFAWFFVSIVLLVPMCANILWVVQVPEGAGTLGASGIVYATNGLVLGLSFINIIYILWSLRGTSKQGKILLLGIWLFNVIVLITLVIPVITTPEGFLNISKEVNAYVHAVSFIGGFLSGIAWTTVVLFWSIIKSLARPSLVVKNQRQI